MAVQMQHLWVVKAYCDCCSIGNMFARQVLSVRFLTFGVMPPL